MHIGGNEQWEKFTLWEKSTRVPLLFLSPVVTTVRTRSAEALSLLDIYPTLVNLAGLPPKEEIEGHSLVPQLKDANAPRSWPAITTAGKDNHGIRTERWRYIRYADGSEEL